MNLSEYKLLTLKDWVSISKLASHVKLSRAYVNQILKGQMKVNADRASEIAHACNMFTHRIDLYKASDFCDDVTELNGDEMKRLKASTIERYTNNMLLNHLDRLQSELDKPLYRVTACKKVFAYNQNNRAYYFECNNLDKELILDCIRRSWNALNI